MKKLTNSITAWQWTPIKFLTGQTTESIGVVILNRPIRGQVDEIIHIWQRAAIRVTVDGGTDRWLSFAKQNNYDCKLYPPDMITGDMDSIQPQTMEFFKHLGTEIILTPDQSETDYTKALKAIKSRADNMGLKLDSIITICETSGRLDQIMSIINTLFRAKEFLPETDIYVLSSASISWLLPPGFHTIDIPQKLVVDKAWCALMPIGSKCKSITTTGLKWNLNGSELEFGGMVSTSNTYDGSTSVTIENSDPVIWSMSTKNLKN